MPAADHAQTIARYENYLAQDPANPMLLNALGDLYHQAGEFDRALQQYDRCLERHPGHRGARSRSANVMLSQHRFEDAEKTLTTLLAEGEPDPALHYNLGLARFYQYRWQDAFDSFKAAQAAGLVGPDVARYLTYVHHQLGQMDAAIEACRQWQAAGDSSAQGYMAVLEMDNGNMPAAHAYAAQVLKAEPGNVDALVVEGMWSTEQQDNASAHAAFTRVVNAQPDNARGWLGLGLAELYRGEHAKSIAALERAIERMPRNVGAIVTLGWARLTARDVAGAEREFRRAIAVDHTFGEAHGALAVALVYQQRHDEARRVNRVAQRLNPMGFGAIYAKGVLLAVDGKREQGEAEVAAALQRPITADGRTGIDHIQEYLRKDIARGNGAVDATPAGKEKRQ